MQKLRHFVLKSSKHRHFSFCLQLDILFQNLLMFHFKLFVNILKRLKREKTLYLTDQVNILLEEKKISWSWKNSIQLKRALVCNTEEKKYIWDI